MNILFDFLPFQHAKGVGGHASFTKRILDELLLRSIPDMKLYAATDSTMQQCKNYNIDDILTSNDITAIDLSKEKLSVVIQRCQIDIFFISIGQLYSRYDLKNIDCKTVMFIHDLFDIERCDNQVDAIIYDKNAESAWSQLKCFLNLYSGRWKRQTSRCYDNIMQLYNSPLTIPCTVSGYTKNAIKYYFPDAPKDIRVYYSPLKYTEKTDKIENEKLSALISSGKPFLLMIAANRRYKNPSILIKVFSRIQKDYPDMHLITLKYGRSIGENHIDIPYLSDSDLENAYEKATALFFGSFFEGFGYPPIEAAKYGTPCVAANVTSIPEILGNAGTYFSPIYPADLYRSLAVAIDNREAMVSLVKERYETIKRVQENHLRQLIEELTTI